MNVKYHELFKMTVLEFKDGLLRHMQFNLPTVANLVFIDSIILDSIKGNFQLHKDKLRWLKMDYAKILKDNRMLYL